MTRATGEMGPEVSSQETDRARSGSPGSVVKEKGESVCDSWGSDASVKHGQQAACMSVSVLRMSMPVCVVGCCAHASTDEDEVGR